MDCNFLGLEVRYNPQSFLVLRGIGSEGKWKSKREVDRRLQFKPLNVIPLAFRPYLAMAVTMPLFSRFYRHCDPHVRFVARQG